MEQVTIMSDNPRMSLREYKELIEQVLGHEKAPRQRGSRKEKDNSILSYRGW